MEKGREFKADFGLQPELREKIGVGVSSLADERHPEINQDAVLVDSLRLVFGVFDGVGGHRAGEVASRLAKELVERRIREVDLGSGSRETAVALAQILKEADEEISLMAREPEYRGMATTAVLLGIVKEGEKMKAVAVYVGDSRFYRLLQAGELESITLDDGPVRVRFRDERRAREVQKKLSNVTGSRQMDALELGLFASRQHLTQCLGLGKIGPHSEIVEVLPGDVLILTTDGVHDNLTDKEIEAIVRSSSAAQEAALRLTANSLARSRESRKYNIRAHPDDMSAVVVEIKK